MVFYCRISKGFAGVLVVVIDLIFPGIMLLKLKGKTSTRSRIIAYLLIVVGSIIGVISLAVTVQTIYQQVKDGSSSSTPGHHNHTNASLLHGAAAGAVAGESFGPSAI